MQILTIVLYALPIYMLEELVRVLSTLWGYNWSDRIINFSGIGLYWLFWFSLIIISF